MSPARTKKPRKGLVKVKAPKAKKATKTTEGEATNDGGAGNNKSSMVAIHEDLQFSDVNVKIEPVDDDDDEFQTLDQVKSFLKSHEPKGSVNVTDERSRRSVTPAATGDASAKKGIRSGLATEEEAREFDWTDIEDEVDDDVGDKDYVAPDVDEVQSEELVDVKPTKLKLKKGVFKGKLHKCDQCDKTFTRAYSLSVHINGFHTKDHEFSCSICSQTFASSSALTQHSAAVTEECSLCSERYCGAMGKERHQNKHAGKEAPCAHCGHIFYLRTDLRRHESAAHADLPKPHACTVCEKFFATTSGANSCETLHTGKYECETCRFQARTPTELKRHSRTHEDVPKVECHLCNSIVRETRLKDHMNLLHSGEVTELPCDLCKKKFTTKRYLRLHKERIHGDKPYGCDECKSSFASLSLLRCHVERVHEADPDAKASVTCDICQESLPGKLKLRQHVKEHHKTKEFPCQECDKVFAQKSSLRTHIKAVHERAVEETCDLCRMVFTAKNSLRKHMATVHIDQNARERFPCPIPGCTHVALAESSLKSHMKSTLHAADRRFKCDLCEQKFTRNWTLQNHIKAVHQGEGKILCFKCGLCGRGFTYHKEYMEHKEMKHDKKCPYCDLVFVTYRAQLRHGRLSHQLTDSKEMLPSDHGVQQRMKRKAKAPCIVCRKLVTVLYLKKHMETAHGVTDYKPPKVEINFSDAEDEEDEDDNGKVSFGTFEENNPEMKKGKKRKSAAKKKPIPKRSKHALDKEN